MLKRLIIAVFGIIIVLAFGINALAGPDYPVGQPDYIQAQSINPNAAKYNSIERWTSVTEPNFRLNPNEVGERAGGSGGASPASTYFCDVLNYSGTSFYYIGVRTTRLLSTRFDTDPGYICTLKTVQIELIGDLMKGAPNAHVYLWADNGLGFPGALLDSVIIPYATLLAVTVPEGFATADFSAAGWVFADGDKYHFGLGVGNVVGDTLAPWGDDGAGPYAGEYRSNLWTGASWLSIFTATGGLDIVMDIRAEHCCEEIPFTDCYPQDYFGPTTAFLSLWRSPHPTYGDSAWAQRFDVGGPETLASVDFAVYDHTTLGLLDPFGDQDLYVSVYDDDGSGLPGALITQQTVSGGSYSAYPALISVSFAPLVLENTFHIALSTNGVWDGLAGTGPGDLYETFVSDDGTTGNNRSNNCWVGGPWVPMVAPFNWGTDNDFLIVANLCRDEFSECSIQNYYGAGDVPATFLAIPNTAGSVTRYAQKFDDAPGGSSCELRQVRLNLAHTLADSIRPLMYTANTLVRVIADLAGYPDGAILHTETLTPADYTAAGYTGIYHNGTFMITIDLNVAVSSDFWVSLEPQVPNFPSGGIRSVARLFTPDAAGLIDGMGAYVVSDPGWRHLDETFAGVTSDGALDITAKVCCVPFSGRDCTPPDSWSARGHDQARTGASQLAIGDAWCDLTVDWLADDTDPAATALTMGPIVHDGRVYQILETAATGSRIRVFDLYTGASVGVITHGSLGNFVENDPLIVGTKMYIAGGDNRVVSRWDITGPALPVAPDWSFTIPAVDGTGPLRRCQLLMVDLGGGTKIVAGGTQLGRAFALDEATGAKYLGWGTNPIILDAGQLVQGSATDGSQLFFGTRQAGVDGDIWAINAATGGVNWQLSTTGGRQASVVYAASGGNPIITEGFPQMSYENGVLYVGSNVQTANFPADGVFYRLNSSTGANLSFAAAPSVLFAYPIIDINLVYLNATTGWVNPPFEGDLVAFSKTTGAFSWNAEEIAENLLGVTGNSAINRHFANASLTCEPEPDPDIIVSADERGILHFWNSITGTELFRRRWDFNGWPASLVANNIASGTAIGLDSAGITHVLNGTNRGALVSLSKQADRPRLEIQDFDPIQAVEFSVATSVIYTVDDIIVNTGCADLTFNAVNVDTATFGPSDPGISPFRPVRPELWDASAFLSEQMAVNAKRFKNPTSIPVIEFEANSALLVSSEESLRNERNYRAASFVPAYLNGVVEPFAGQILPGGDSMDLVLDVNPSMINRGPQIFYIELDTDDPDYFLSAGSVAQPNDHPELIVTLVGGCLTDTTALEFGLGGANYQWVSNTSRLADGDWDAHGFEIDGEDALVFQGTYVFGVSTERIAMNVTNWSGQPQTNSWYAVQGDPNYCDNNCKPALFTGVSLGSISSDGITYTPISGNLICKSWIDSVQDYSLGGGIAAWNWRNYGAPFNDTLTMGVTANTRTIGALDTDGLTNLTLEIFEVTERNGDSIPGWKFACNYDYDVSPVFGNGPDTAILDQSISAVWTTSASSAAAVDYAYGVVKLPFGCGYTPMKNAMSIDANQGHWNSTDGRGNPYWDSSYFYMSLASGTERSHVMQGSADQQWHATLVEHDFGPNETITFGSVNFGLNEGVTNPAANGGGGELAALANLANKWAGFGRGDVNDDNAVNLGDIMALAAHVNAAGPGAYPFAHLGDVDADGDVDNADLNYLIAYYFDCGPCPQGEWTL